MWWLLILVIVMIVLMGKNTESIWCNHKYEWDNNLGMYVCYKCLSTTKGVY